MSLLLAAFLLQLQIASPPAVPQQAVSSGLVVLQGTVTKRGQVSNIQVLQGSPPFIQPSLEAFQGWLFKPGSSPKPVTATFLYRARTIVPNAPYRLSLQSPCCAIPRDIVDPGYPVNSVAEGAVMMQVQITKQGIVKHIDVVRPEPSLTETAVNAVRQWKFSTSKPESTIVVISFLRPVLSEFRR